MVEEIPVDDDTFRRSMRLLAGGVCIVATAVDGEPHGLCMTAVCSLTIDPPTLVACVNRNGDTHAAVCRSKRVSVNVLADEHVGMAELFSSSSVKGPRRFDDAKWTRMSSGVPALSDALVVLDCEVVREMPVGQHSVFFCEVQSTRQRAGNRHPLVHFDREFCTLQPVHVS